MRLFFRLTLIFVCLMLGARLTFADSISKQHAPKVIVSIKPLHAWVSAVMKGVAVPDLLLNSSDSVHHYQLKPSDASNLSKANIIFIADKKMEVYLKKPLHSLANKAKIIALDSAPGIKLLPMRKNGAGNKKPHVIKVLKPHSQHVRYNFHFWLDPQNAVAATKYIADVLAKTDPEHASIYKANAENYVSKLEELIKETQQKLKDHQDIKFMVFHDAYYYYEKRFGVEALEAVTINPEHQPSAHRIRALHNKVKTSSVACVFAEPQFPPAVVHSIIEGTLAKQGVLDPIGANLTPGANSYFELVNKITEALIVCSSK